MRRRTTSSVLAFAATVAAAVQAAALVSFHGIGADPAPEAISGASAQAIDALVRLAGAGGPARVAAPEFLHRWTASPAGAAPCARS